MIWPGGLMVMESLVHNPKKTCKPLCTIHYSEREQERDRQGRDKWTWQKENVC